MPWTAALGGIVTALVLIPLLNRFARKIGAVSKVAPDRWHRSGDRPRLAGPALFAALLPWLPTTDLIIAGGFCAIGCADDIRRLSPGLKALLMAVPAAVAVAATGVWWLGPALWLCANAMNLLDHADGVAAASALATLTAAGSPAGWAGAGGCAGFLVFNFPPARCFLGDGGSLLLGAITVLQWRHAGPLSTLAWCAIPLADAVTVSIRRLLRHQRPWVGDTDHSSHHLLRRGVPAAALPPAFVLATLAAGLLGQAVLRRLGWS
ncbi:MAG: undecaprenyl/decaprenyl-phosphate alpha-N-acetylglucosaminyl 1-phosphate transferase [Azospirillum sp.]|nr:undecaprenyl/decaprenyl-phosphate alpha-N-acetylglucosaminyl 1-phosphate transferase [Azospirillum sp.]